MKAVLQRRCSSLSKRCAIVRRDTGRITANEGLGASALALAANRKNMAQLLRYADCFELKQIVA